MTTDQSLDWCTGCAIPAAKQVNLPADFKAGDPMPENLTVHDTPRERKKFAFVGNPRSQNRYYL